jgi:hypothetical protein
MLQRDAATFVEHRKCGPALCTGLTFWPRARRPLWNPLGSRPLNDTNIDRVERRSPEAVQERAFHARRGLVSALARALSRSRFNKKLRKEETSGNA